jgi:membrane-associated phospholipid phosphatase
LKDKPEIVPVKRRPGWWLLAIAGCIVLLLLGFWFDGAVVGWMRAIQVPEVYWFMRQVSFWGDWYWLVFFGLVAAGFAHLRRSQQWLRIFLAMVAALAIAGSVNRGIKIATGRARPSVEMDAGWHGWRFTSKYNSFPSGHTASSTAFFVTLAFLRWRVGVLLLWAPLLIGFSRMYLNAHHISDVIGGAIVGTFVALLVSRHRLVQHKN